MSESNRPKPGLTRLAPVLKTGMITGPHALPLVRLDSLSDGCRFPGLHPGILAEEDQQEVNRILDSMGGDGHGQVASRTEIDQSQ